ncbi:DUF4199 domain-containing protein [Galbibacter sp. EGI 63066]|uniref:DUF4199 domain-containing protein n=1 Tax=Galbibacter sp. EGI 63066 TaxID=2993559 RepID=UPI0022497F54|nr:DUF4199 domain-containing protein [Galbibacter sp. EGI 63066]MCX2679145.1 DUF4199 domain-containing protein [Galbibacter sp. EGI 63066]
MSKYKIEIKWAFIFMGVGLLWMLLEKLSGLHSTHIDKHMYLTNLFAIPAIIMFVLALKDKKKKFYNGQMTFKQGFVCGLIISVIIAVFGPVTQWITSYVITPEYFPNVIDYSLETGYHDTREEAEAFFNYGNYAKQSVLWGLIMGVVTSAIVAFFVRTKNQK